MNNLFTTKVSYEHVEQLRKFLSDNKVKLDATDMIEYISINDITIVLKENEIVNARIKNCDGETKYITTEYLAELESSN